MAAFTAKDVKELRDKTGVSMMECKKALESSDGNMDEAMKYLREKGLAAAAKKASRIAAEGLALAIVDNDKKVGVILEVNSETDFVSKNADFRAYVENVGKIIIDKNPADVEALLKLEYSAGNTVEEELRDKILVIGENLNIRRFERIEGDVVAYIHGEGRIAVLVLFEADAAASASSKLDECGKDVAMQIAALNPLYLNKDTMPASALEEEKQILITNIKNDPKMANKPDNIIEKMVEGRLSKFVEAVCLLEQDFVKDGNVTVAKYVENVAKEIGGSMTVSRFVRFERGEGMEKRQDDFASEVAGMM